MYPICLLAFLGKPGEFWFEFFLSSLVPLLVTGKIGLVV